MPRVRLFAVLALVVLSGCAAPGASDGFDTDRDLGYVDGYAHDDVFAFETGDGLTESQLEAVTYRSMARIEVVRGLKYERDVDIEIVSRDEYRAQRAASRGNGSAFRNEVWRGAFLVDGGTDVDRVFDDLYADSIQGYYVNDRIVIIADDTDEVRIDRRTLVHELTHALQDQHFGIGRESETIDGLRAENGLLEGEAGYVPTRYDRRCSGEWQCLPDPQPPAASGEALTQRSFTAGLFLSIYAPYAAGPPFAADLHDRGGWDAIDRAHDDPPRSTAQLLHPERYPETEPVAVELGDRSSDGWEPVTDGGEPRTETIGEATLFATLWENGVVDRPLTRGAGALSPYNYTHPATAGWAGDGLQVYRATDGTDRTGHVWRLAWEDSADAREFADAYRRLLENRGAERIRAAGEGVYRIPDGESFAGTYRVTVTGDRVEIVGAPTVDALAAIRPAEADAREPPAALEGASRPLSAGPPAPTPVTPDPVAAP
ncbi:hypothetical protein A6E15_14125 [Natrinema saccharevitans]|uniref:DUF4157 domain-containing protein n=1 Tax=Natrinema saccharevitans TaxID=301967 RepID=A0A1S8AZJ4_9EURY|nr:Hvo_1808 family surface protein [Natrinema saccharevitans]OLZ42037.1 hypothetical protein A6E15_14125 [Natrinema saccharevitans]